MNDLEATAILKAIDDGRKESMQAIGELAKEFAEFRGNVDARVKATEDYIASDKVWSRVNRALVPLYAIGHAVLARYGFKI